MKCIVKAVRTKKEMNDFVALPRKIYRGNGCYVPDLEKDVRGWFDPKHNPGLGHCDVLPFVAYSETGEPVGRIVGNSISKSSHNATATSTATIVSLH